LANARAIRLYPQVEFSWAMPMIWRMREQVIQVVEKYIDAVP